MEISELVLRFLALPTLLAFILNSTRLLPGRVSNVAGDTTSQKVTDLELETVGVSQR